MSSAVNLDVTCGDFLWENPHLYARKARRKKIALISVQAANRYSAEVRIELGATKLVVGEQDYAVESPGLIIRKLSEFTWDFVAYSILDFHPVLIFIDAFCFLTGPLYNRRLTKQLRLLSDGAMILRPGDCKKTVVGFRDVPKGARQLQLFYCSESRERGQIICEIRKEPR